MAKSTRIKNSEFKDAIYEALELTSIPQKIYMLYYMADAIEMLRSDVEDRLEAFYRHFGLEGSSRLDDTPALKGIRLALKIAGMWYEKLNTKMQDKSWEKYGVRGIDACSHDCSEINWWLLNLFDLPNDAIKCISDEMSEIPKVGRFTQQDYDRFLNKKKTP